MEDKLFCPSCGAENSLDQNFCRSCGFGLENVITELTGETAVDNEQSELEFIEPRGRTVSVGVAALSVFVAVFLMLLFYLVIDKKLFAQGRYIEGILFLSLMVLGLAGAVLFAWSKNIFWGRSLPENNAGVNQVAQRETSDLLPESTFEPVPSVVDGTTRKLKVKLESSAEDRS